MQNRDSRADVLRRGVVISPNAHMVRDLARLLDMMRDMRGRSMTVYLNVNNHYVTLTYYRIG